MTDISPILDRRLTDTLATLHQNFTDTSPVFITCIYHGLRNPFFGVLGLGMVCCYNCFISGRLVYLYVFASYNHPYTLKIKCAITRDCQFLLEVVLWIYEHSLDCFVGLLYFLHLQVLIPSMYSADTWPILGRH